MGKTIRDLLLALVNATLILLAVCLFLGWKLSQTVEDVTDNLKGALISVTPLGDEVRALHDELQDVRDNVNTLMENRGDRSGERMQALNVQMTQIDTKLTQIRDQLQGLKEMPETVMNTAISTGVDRVMMHAANLRGCTATEDPLS
ncbi:MAG: hypothetical protein ACU0BB_15245 [Paracoccaceae bacterium]|jgi:ElaB/YqjD/DUF883 family membrane-anchored ribosome-binding protein